MIEVVVHGRGGQGAVTAAELVAQAAIEENRYAQAFPSFGPERRGAPVAAYIRVSEGPISLREKIYTPDVVIVLDPSLLELVNVFDGLKPGGDIIINSPDPTEGTLEELGSNYRLAVVDAGRIAQETLGVPITNTAIIGALIRGTGIVRMKTMEPLFRARFGRLADRNLEALKRAYEETVILEEPRGKTQSKRAEKASTRPAGPVKRTEVQDRIKVEIAADIVVPGSTAENFTGSWRGAGRPATDYEKCVKCGRCWILCPDTAYIPKGDGYFDWDERYCKGCGICVVECPKQAIQMVKEGEQ
jgi:pyruvate ferredoxin oxidoreductase gamma subunit